MKKQSLICIFLLLNFLLFTVQASTNSTSTSETKTKKKEKTKKIDEIIVLIILICALILFFIYIFFMCYKMQQLQKEIAYEKLQNQRFLNKKKEFLQTKQQQKILTDSIQSEISKIDPQQQQQPLHNHKQLNAQFTLGQNQQQQQPQQQQQQYYQQQQPQQEQNYNTQQQQRNPLQPTQTNNNVAFHANQPQQYQQYQQQQPESNYTSDKKMLPTPQYNQPHTQEKIQENYPPQSTVQKKLQYDLPENEQSFDQKGIKISDVKEPGIDLSIFNKTKDGLKDNEQNNNFQTIEFQQDNQNDQQMITDPGLQYTSNQLVNTDNQMDYDQSYDTNTTSGDQKKISLKKQRDRPQRRNNRRKQ